MSEREAPTNVGKGSKRGLVLAHRIGLDQWLTHEEFSRLLALLITHRGATDEVWLSDARWPRRAYTPIEELRRVTEVMKRRIAELREAGIASVGINVSYTLGHGNAIPEYVPPSPI